MEGQTAWLIVLIILALAQAVVLALRIIWERNAKKNNPLGERVAKLEEAMDQLEKRMDRLEDSINKKYKSK